MLCLPPLRRRWYDFFLRTHQILALVALAFSWQHTLSGPKYVQLCILGTTVVMFSVLILQFGHILMVNLCFIGGFPRASIDRCGTVGRIELFVPSSFTVKAGQMIDLYIPAIRLLQCHPLTIVAVEANGRGMKLVLMVEPRRGWTLDLIKKERATHFALFAGPHGLAAPVHDYGIVVLAASGPGLFAVLPYLQSLARRFTTFTTQCRRVHLVWQVDDIGACLGSRILSSTDGHSRSVMGNGID